MLRCSAGRISADGHLLSTSETTACFRAFGQWKHDPLTAFREKNGEIGVLSGHYSETLEGFAAQIGDMPSGRTFQAIVEVIKLNFNLN